MNVSPSRLRLTRSGSATTSSDHNNKVPILASSVFYDPSRRRNRRAITSSSSAEADADAGCCTSPTADWMNWVEQSIDFFGCEAQNDGFLGKALALAKKELMDDFIPRNYCQLHEEFFDSLLKEQLLQEDYAQELDYSSTGISDTSYDSGMTSLDSSSFLPPPSIQQQQEEQQQQQQLPNKKQRIPYLHKLSPRRNKRIAPIEAYNQQYNPALLEEQEEEPLGLDDLVHKDLPEPHSYVHVHAQLQKDKGKGLSLGSAICAEGRDATLNKLRDKMKLVLQISGGDRKSSLQKRPAKIYSETQSFCETRSMIELKLGFLSLNYGLLLKWDCRTGKIIFVCLRKICHESFYKQSSKHNKNNNNKNNENTRQSTSAAAVYIQKSDLEAPPFVVVSGLDQKHHALYQRTAGTEVVLVDHPYRVPQDDFGPSIITLQILQVSGISLKKKWTISVTFAGHSEWVSLDYSKETKRLVPKRPSMIWEVPQNVEDGLNLEICLFETPKRKKHSSRLAASMTLPLASLIAQPTMSNTKSWSLTMPMKTGKLSLNLQHRSDYTHWLYQELDKRRLEEVSYYKLLERQQQDYWNLQQQQQLQSEQEEPELYDWLCGVCWQ
jgi:hypothetical protein